MPESKAFDSNIMKSMIEKEEEKQMRKKEMAANLLLFFVAIIWGGGFVAGKMALSTLSPMTALFFRFGLAMILCGLCFPKRIMKTSKKTALQGCIIGSIQMVAQAVQLIGLKYTSAAKQSFLCTAYVALVPFISWLVIRKRPKITAFVAGFLALTGIGFICLTESFSIGFGDGMSLGFAFIFGLQIVLIGRFVGEDADSIQLSFFQFFTAALLSGVIVLIKSDISITISGESLIGIFYLGILNTFVAMVGQNLSQKYAKDTTAALIISLESVFGFLFSLLYYHEKPGLRLVTGGILCFAAVFINTVGDQYVQLTIKKE